MQKYNKRHNTGVEVWEIWLPCDFYCTRSWVRALIFLRGDALMDEGGWMHVAQAGQGRVWLGWWGGVG